MSLPSQFALENRLCAFPEIKGSGRGGAEIHIRPRARPVLLQETD